MLAGLSETEMEAVLAHEMTHAKLIQRGIKTWLNGGLNRAMTLSRGLAQRKEWERQTKQSSGIAGAFLGPSDSLTRLGTRLAAAYSRQDEFAADLGSAQLCGSAAARSALRRVDVLARVAARLPWRDRVAQLQLEGGFSRWLAREFAEGSPRVRSDDAAELLHKYSTHPLLRDRLAALPQDSSVLPENAPPAIARLANPDGAAERLIAEIQRVVAVQEAKDSKELRKWTSKLSLHADLGPMQGLGLVLILGGGISSLVIWSMIGGGASLLVLLTSFVLGVVCYRKRYNEKLSLPIPDYALLIKGAGEKKPDHKALEKQIETELRERFPKKEKRRHKMPLLKEGYEALGKCDFLRCHVATRLVLEGDHKNVEAWLGFAVASAALGLQFGTALQEVRKQTRMSTPSALWGGAWVELLAGEWVRAEALLDKLVLLRAPDPTILTLLALAQQKRGKIQSALATARRACSPQPKNVEHAKLLINLLLDTGRPGEARPLLLRYEDDAKPDSDLLMARFRLGLMTRDHAGAAQTLEQLERQPDSGGMLVRAAHSYEFARKNEEAVRTYEKALGLGHYPEAFIGLGRVEADRGNKEQARSHFLAALNIERPPADGAIGPLPLFGKIMEQLLALREPTLHCQAWVATVRGTANVTELANRSFMIFAQDRQEAEQHFHTVTKALRPGQPPLIPGMVGWREAAKEQQPDGPVRPGLQWAFVDR